MSPDEDLPTFQRFMLAFDVPAYLRRARQVEAEWTHLLAICARERDRRLELPRLRLAQLIVATDAVTSPQRLPLSDAEREAWLGLYHAWQPQLRSAVAPAGSDAAVQDLVQRAVTAFRRFNADWEQYLTDLDLVPINQVRERYNCYYVLEKECAVRSSRTAREGFEPLPPVTHDDLRREFPPLPVPVCG